MPPSSSSSSAAAATTASATTQDANLIFQHLAGSKHKKSMGARMNESAAVGPNRLSQKLLQNMGWTEGTGLGRRRDGRTRHIQVKQRADGVGLGNTEAQIDPVVAGDQWWKNSVGSTLAKLSAEKKSKKRDKKLHYTDEELFQATGGARFGMRAQTQQHGKWKRAESGISEQDEEEAHRRKEWDGMSVPKVVLSQDKKKRKRDAEPAMSVVTEETDKSDVDDKPKKSKKKQKTDSNKKKKKDKKPKTSKA
jgi:hypothetical protein